VAAKGLVGEGRNCATCPDMIHARPVRIRQRRIRPEAARHAEARSLDSFYMQRQSGGGANPGENPWAVLKNSKVGEEAAKIGVSPTGGIWGRWRGAANIPRSSKVMCWVAAGTAEGTKLRPGGRARRAMHKQWRQGPPKNHQGRQSRKQRRRFTRRAHPALTATGRHGRLVLLAVHDPRFHAAGTDPAACVQTRCCPIDDELTEGRAVLR